MYGIKLHGIPTILKKSNIESTKQHIEVLDEAHKEAIAAHKLAAERMEQYFKSKFTPYTIGQKVWLENRNLWLSFQSRKIAPKRLGPFKITKVLSLLTYKLDLPEDWKIHNLFHATFLTNYSENDIHRPNLEPPLPDIIDSFKEYKIEGIMNHCTHWNLTKYYIKWKDYSYKKNSWETEDNLLPHAQELLNEYWADNNVTDSKNKPYKSYKWKQ